MAGSQDWAEPQHLARSTAGWRRRVETGLRQQVPVILALSGVAIVQPVLDLFGRNPEFFVAGRYSTTQVVMFALVVAVVPAALAALMVLAAHALDARVGEVAYWGAAGGLAVLFAALLLRTLGLDGVGAVVLGAVVLAGVVLWLDHTSGLVHRLLSWVALGNVVFLGAFLVVSPTSDLVFGQARGSVGRVEVPTLDGPVILIILDELPLTTILDAEGTIDEARYPNIARLAESSTWFRNASSLHPLTQWAAPQILAGTVPEAEDLPNLATHPRNVFTLFGDRYPIRRYETVTDMCPPSACTPPPRQSLRTALRDAAVVYGHKVLPSSLSADLPAIDHSWGNFGAVEPVNVNQVVESQVTEDDPYGVWHNMDPEVRAAHGQLQVLEGMIGQMSAEPALHMSHVALPHYPWSLTPFGWSLTRALLNEVEPDDPAFEARVRQAYQVHSLQVGAVDVAVGRMIDHLQAVGAWDDALVVVTSDHGTSLTPPVLGRFLNEDSQEELLRIPLFVKVPGQTEGELRDDVALTIDVLPSIVDVLGIRTDWEFEGHSLFDGSRGRVEPKVDPSVEPALVLARQHAADFAGEPGWDALGAVGELGPLVGSPVSDHPTGDPSELRWELDERDLLASLPTPANQMPLLLMGAVDGDDGSRPPDLLVAINGRIAGVVGAYLPDGDGWRFSGVMSPFFRVGANEVTAYEVERTSGDAVVLHPVGG